MPDVATGATVLEYLCARFPHDAARLTEKVSGGEVVDAAGVPIDPSTIAGPRADIYLYRDPPVESAVPFSLDVLHRDENLLVVDKPHFLATTPRGAYIARSALVLLRRQFDLPELSPAHRLDRLTAGVLVFTVQRQARRPYQEMFAQRTVTKQYEAIAPLSQNVDFPLTVHSRIVKERGVHHIPVVNGDQLIGIVSFSDILRVSFGDTFNTDERTVDAGTPRGHRRAGGADVCLPLCAGPDKELRVIKQDVAAGDAVVEVAAAVIKHSILSRKGVLSTILGGEFGKPGERRL